MGMSKVVLKTAELFRPALEKVFPRKLLIEARKKFLERSTKQLAYTQLRPFKLDYCQKGINLIGNIKGDSGLGQSCRLVANVLEHCGYPLCIVQHSISPKLSAKDTTYEEKLKKSNPYGVNLFHMNPHELATAYLQLGKQVWDGHYNIAYWLWELEDFPDEWVDCIHLLDEIWTPAEYISEGIRKKTDKPVITVPYHVTAPVSASYDRAYFGLPMDKFLFLMMFDCGSMMERKNPEAVIKTFQMSFDNRLKDVGLIIKINGGSGNDVAKIKSYIAGYENIYLINQVFTKLEINSLIKCADTVVSLHRAEGFGLVLAEAMLNGVPCIATNWSANTEFMNSQVACMVDYTLVPLERDIGPYKKGNRWAEPNVEQAAEYMKLLYEKPEHGCRLAEAARKHVEDVLGMERAVTVVQTRLSRIYGEKVE